MASLDFPSNPNNLDTYTLNGVTYYYNAAIGAWLSKVISNSTASGNFNPGAINITSQTLTDGSTISWDVSQGAIAYVTLAGNRTIASPSNLKVGTLILHVNQDATGGRTLTWNSVFKWPVGTAPVLSTSANAKDIFSFICDGTYLYGSYIPDVR